MNSSQTLPNFSSDYQEGAHARVLDALVATNMEQSSGYGTDEHCERARDLIREACQAPDADVYFLVGGTQTNATVIDAILLPWQGVIAPNTGHINMHEAGIVERGGHKILDTPAVDGKIAQKTEDLVGPYELHDFFLYYALRWGFGPKKVFRLALYALGGRYERDFILKWLKNFYRRFFNQQFKRSCLPDGPKVGTVTLSPRGDWRMPSDAVNALWAGELEEL